MKTALICHHDDDLSRLALPRWLASFSELAGVVIVQENRRQQWRRITREMKRVGCIRFADVLAYRFYHRLFLSSRDAAYERALLDRLSHTYAQLPAHLPQFSTTTPNSNEAREFLHAIQPELMVARCKVILKPAVFAIPRLGTYVMHPGICPQYRNAHGCFWALAMADLKNVGMTLLRVDKGVDTGPAYGFYSYEFDEVEEPHTVIQHRTLFDNLDRVRDKLLEIETGTATPIDTSGRPSGAWGQPWLTRYLAWKRAAKRRTTKYETDIAALS
jgi:hypothetical protein